MIVQVRIAERQAYDPLRHQFAGLATVSASYLPVGGKAAASAA
jgi:hypothetical protein